ncbi:MAG: hypothetical protein RLY16_86 [Bacteroidota bacterium]
MKTTSTTKSIFNFFATNIKLILVLLAFALQSGAQVTIPSANTNGSSTNYPFGTYYGYQRSAMLYTAAEIASTGTITTLGYYLNSVGSGSNKPGRAITKIYFKTTTASTLSASTFDSYKTGATLVYDGVLTTFTGGGWNSLTLTAPFAFSGGSNNLLILIETNTTGTGNESSSAKQYRWNNVGSNRAQTWAQDNSAPTGNGTLSSSRANTRLTFYSGGTAPVISNLPSRSGGTGSKLVINGINLSSATSVKIGGTAVASIQSNSSTQIIATVAAGTTGKVTVTTALGTATSTETYTYYASTFSRSWVGAGNGGTGTDFNNPANWNPIGYPEAINNLTVQLVSSATIQMSENTTINALTFRTSTSNLVGIIDVDAYTFTINSTTNADITSGSSNSLMLGVNGGTQAGVIDFKGNVTLGTTDAGDGVYLIGNSNSTLKFRSNLTFGVFATIHNTNKPNTAIFDGSSTQTITWDNVYYYAMFNNVIIGQTNNPTVNLVSSLVVPDNLTGDLTINGSSVLNVGTSQWNRQTTGGTFTMNGSATLKLGGTSSVTVGGTLPGGFAISGNNFPAGFSTYSLANGSTVEYRQANGGIQTIAPVTDIPVSTYGNLTFTNTTGSGDISLIANNNFSVSNTFTVGDFSSFTPSASTVISGAGTLTGNGQIKVSNITGTADLLSQYTISNKTLTNLTVTYNGSANQTVNALNYKNLNIPANGTRTITFANSGEIAVNGSFTPDASTTSYTVTGSAFNFNGAAQTVPAFTYNILATSGSNTKTMGGNATILDSLKINTGTTLALDGKVITLKSTETKTARVAAVGGSITYGTNGKFSIERFIPARRSWRLISFPVASSGAPTINAAIQEGAGGTVTNPNPGYGTHITGGNFTSGFDQNPAGNPSMKELVNGVWTGISNTNQAITNKTAYFLFVRGSRANILSQGTASIADNTTLRTSGSIKTGNQTVSLTTTGWTLVGNPFASPIDLDRIATSNTAVINKNFKFWDPRLGGNFNVGGYVTASYNGSSYDYVPTPASSINEFAQSGAAFFVDAKAVGTLTITEAHKTGNGNTNVFRPSDHQSKLFINLQAAHSSGATPVVDGVMAAFDYTFKNGIDEMDATKLYNSGTESISLVRNDKNYSIERRDFFNSTDTIFIQLGNMAARRYKLEINPINFNSSKYSAIVEDLFLGTNTALNFDSTTYINFTIAAGYNPNRFRIVFKSLQPITAVLPVTITKIQAFKVQQQVKVEWNVENQINLSQYIIERSADGKNFQPMTTVSANNQRTATNYQTLDAKPFSGNNYYRLKMVDLDGSFKFSAIVKVNATSIEAPISIYPNPVVNHTMQINMPAQAAGKYQVQVYNLNGEKISSSVINHQGGVSVYPVSVNQSVPAGMYKVEISNQEGRQQVINISIL